MKMKLFMKEYRGYIGIYYLSIFLTVIYCGLMNFIDLKEVLYILLFNTFILWCFLAFRYYKQKQVYELFHSGLNTTQEAFLELGNSTLGENISEVLKKQHKLYEEELQKYDKIYKEHITFINQWVHQMKTPLSVIDLHLQDNEGDAVIESIGEEVIKLNKGLNMAMYFARLDSFQKDFRVEKLSLYKLVMDSVNEEKKLFIKNRIMPRVEIDESLEVYSDLKWLKFILQQLIINGVKYSKCHGKYLTIAARKEEKKIILHIVDEGFGIPKKDIKRVFDPFFTGENGRNFGESTGMGLYMVKKICDNLNHGINIESKVQEGTKVTIVFTSG